MNHKLNVVKSQAKLGFNFINVDNWLMDNCHNLSKSEMDEVVRLYEHTIDSLSNLQLYLGLDSVEEE